MADKKYREFWIEYYKGEPRSVHEKCDGDWQLHVIEAQAVTDLEAKLAASEKMCEELVKSFRKYAMHIDTCVYHCGPSVEYDCDCGLEEALDNYNKHKAGE